MSVNWIVLNIFDRVFVVYNTIVASKVEITTLVLWEYSNNRPACPRYCGILAVNPYDMCFGLGPQSSSASQGSQN